MLLAQPGDRRFVHQVLRENRQLLLARDVLALVLDSWKPPGLTTIAHWRRSTPVQQLDHSSG
jgi:hypothetical protein